MHACGRRGITQPPSRFPGEVFLSSINKAQPLPPRPLQPDKSIHPPLLAFAPPRHPSGGVRLQSYFSEKKEMWREREGEGGTPLKGRRRQQEAWGGGGWGVERHHMNSTRVWLNTETRKTMMDGQKSLGRALLDLSPTHRDGADSSP